MVNRKSSIYLVCALCAGPLFSREQDGLTRQLKSELRTNFHGLKKYDSLLYYMAYRMNDSIKYTFKTNKGGVLEKSQTSSRYVDIDMRVGSPEIDNTHKAVDNFYVNYPYGVRNLRVPLRDPEKALRAVLLFGSDYAYRSARQKYSNILNDIALRPNEKQTGLDFAPQKVVTKIIDLEIFLNNPDSLKQLFKDILGASEVFNHYDFILSSSISYDFTDVVERFVNTEGSTAVHRKSVSSISIYVETLSEDGMVLWLDKNIYGSVFSPKVSSDSLISMTETLVQRLDTLRKAPVLVPYVGPVILKGVAAGVFIHEVFGHRVEGHRQKIREEGQTFLSKVGEVITAPFIDILDNPGMESHRGRPLNGHYIVDNEGVVPVSTLLVQKGIFKGFLQSRSVVQKDQASNGHARGNLGRELTSRMGNTILQSHSGIPYDNLRVKLKKILKKKNLEFGLIVEDISGGYTLTDRNLPQSFKLEPLYIKKIFADSRPDEVVRGVDAVGTPLNSLKEIVATGDDPAVFNGYCGAESGWVPVSTISPSLLLNSLEFELKTGNQEEKPYLKSPVKTVVK